MGGPTDPMRSSMTGSDRSPTTPSSLSPGWGRPSTGFATVSRGSHPCVRRAGQYRKGITTHDNPRRPRCRRQACRNNGSRVHGQTARAASWFRCCHRWGPCARSLASETRGRPSQLSGELEPKFRPKGGTRSPRHSGLVASGPPSYRSRNARGLVMDRPADHDAELSQATRGILGRSR